MILVDVTSLFPLTLTGYHKATRNKLFGYGVPDQF